MKEIFNQLTSIFTNFNSLSVILALIPPVTFLTILLTKFRRDKNIKTYIYVFLGGTMTVIPIFLYQLTYQHLTNNNPSIDFVGVLKSVLSNQHIAFWAILFYLFIALTEELIKFYVVKNLDKNQPQLITTINDALKLGIAAGLGFAFAENIKYFSDFTNFDISGSYKGLIQLFIGRTFITLFAHMMFSCIFAYFYGISKFAKDFVDFEKWQGKFVKPTDYQSFSQKNIMKGFSLSLIAHAAFNLSLELPNIITSAQIPLNKIKLISQISAISIVIVMIIYVLFLLQRKTGNLTFILADKYRSSMAPKDEEVVLELIGMWYKEGRYQEVQDICQRLLKRDPDNNVVKLFKNHSADKLAEQNQK